MGKMKRRAPRGGGKMNQKNMMKQLQKMQSEMAQAQANLEEQEVQGTAGGGAVTVTMDGAKRVKAVHIDPDVIDEDDIEMLEDLIVAAVNEAGTQVDAITSDQMGQLTQGINIPGLS